MDSPIRRRARRVAAALAVLTLAACGGGGGGNSVAPPPPPPPNADTTVVSGKITFDRVPHAANNGLDYGATRADPARGVLVQLLDGTGAVVATATTDANGDYAMTVTSGQTLTLRARAQMLATGTPSWDVQVVDNTANQALYVLDGTAQLATGDDQTRNLHAASGWSGSAYTAPRSAGPFAILDSLYDAMQLLLAVAPQTAFPALTVNWSENNRPQGGNLSDGDITTTFYTRDAQNNSEIYVLGAANSDTDEYDTHVVVHEWGHFYEDRFSRSDSMGGGHSPGDRLDPRVAFSEGLGYALAGMALGDPETRDSGGFNQASGFSIDVEQSVGVLNPGWYSEGSAQAILYDLFDAADDATDTLTLGFAPLHEVFSGAFAASVAPTTIFSFLDALRAARPGDVAAIDAIVGPQDIVTAGTDAYGTGETNNAGNADDVLPVFTLLPADGSTVTVCSIGGNGPGDFGTFNKLSNRRLLRFTLAASGTYQLRVSGGSDPDLLLFQGALLDLEEGIGGPETITRSLSAGDYVVEVYEHANLTDTPAGRTCLNVSLTPQ